MSGYTFRTAAAGDAAAIAAFVRRHWKGSHPLVELPDFFEYYYRASDGALRFALAEREGGIAALAGFVPASGLPAPDVWVSLWVADPAARGAGLELMDAMPRLTGCRTLACNNIRPETCPFYEFLGHKTGRVPHFYRLSPSRACRIAQIAYRDIPAAAGDGALRPLPSPQALAQSGFVPPRGAKPYKDMGYIEKRYFSFPRRRYSLYAAMLPGREAPAALLAARVSRALGSAALRIVDYIGPREVLPRLGRAVDGLMDECGAEYADMYCAGLEAGLLREAGFCERAQGDANIIPNYLDPPLIRNIEYWYFTSDARDFTVFRADGDQDRPNSHP